MRGEKHDDCGAERNAVDDNGAAIAAQALSGQAENVLQKRHVAGDVTAFHHEGGQGFGWDDGIQIGHQRILVLETHRGGHHVIERGVGAFEQAPRHSTSSQLNLPSADTVCGVGAIRARQMSISSPAPQIMQVVVPQIWMFATVPTGCSWNMK